MRSTTLIPAAQYLRMSTDEQQNSIQNQSAAIERYAAARGFELVQTYSDLGKSGVVLKSRTGLLKLLQDVVSRQTKYKAVLVYDVSRWGRFQDVDEAAHYEFICRNSGVAVYYCAEPFENDGTPTSTFWKAFKRSMASEFSRRLGTRVFENKRRVAQLGFSVGGQAPLGLRRFLVSSNSRRNRILQRGERKGLRADHVIFVPGPKTEVDCVRRIFRIGSPGQNGLQHDCPKVEDIR